VLTDIITIINANENPRTGATAYILGAMKLLQNIFETLLMNII
jgi:hypothetical protein